MIIILLLNLICKFFGILVLTIYVSAIFTLNIFNIMINKKFSSQDFITCFTFIPFWLSYI